MFGAENQRAAMRSNASGVQRLTTAMNASTPTSSRHGLTARALGDRAVGLHHQPSGAEQRVADRHAEAAQQGERRRPVEWSAGEGAVLHLDALDQAAEDHALAKAASVEPPAKAKFQ